VGDVSKRRRRLGVVAAGEPRETGCDELGVLDRRLLVGLEVPEQPSGRDAPCT
jgi:hypothetical protein